MTIEKMPEKMPEQAAIEGIAEVMRRPNRASDPANKHHARRLRYAAQIVTAMRDEPALREAVRQVIDAGPAGAEVETETVTHWGAELWPGCIRWDPSHGTGHHVPYSEEDARADVASTEGARLVTRTETTTVVTTPWKHVDGGSDDV